ncbi:unnamed protein product [Dracunculus medinensis]|uniref:MacB_PCD domain-containing protein n=1 Tax=Dracunculus medinensis TaxID=318479 RepID=A0A0N4UIJ0_DRAME|nr:unnamed protein product [Dracunculus medinensis]
MDEISTVLFRLAEGWPKKLHHRLLFLPLAAFPLANGTVVLISGDVFSTYDLKSNTPIAIGDKEKAFPNLPDGLVSGIPVISGRFDAYNLFDKQTVYEYSLKTMKILLAQPLKNFLLCK